MTFEQFVESLKGPLIPEGISVELQALWTEKRGDWKEAHLLVQSSHTKEAAWVHAYLHRKEGNTGNAGYWYARAGKPGSKKSHNEEWEEIVRELLENL